MPSLAHAHIKVVLETMVVVVNVLGAVIPQAHPHEGQDVILG